MAAGIAALDVLRDPSLWRALDQAGDRLVAGLRAAAKDAGVAVQCRRVGAMLGLFFAENPVTDWNSAARSDTARFATYHAAMLERGVYLPPSQFEAAFLSTAHGELEITRTVDAARESFRLCR